MTAIVVTALVVIGVLFIGGLVVLVIMLRDAWQDRGVVDEDDWVADPNEGWISDRGLFATGDGLGGGCGGSGV